MNTQLAKIVAPSINEVDYASKMQGVFEIINENFKKIASLPFIQGVQGDSYELVVKEIWNKDVNDNNKWKITSEGAVLLKYIFCKDEDIAEGTSFETCKDIIGNLINGVSPLDSFGTGRGDPLNNNLYFYVVIDDAGVESEQQLGQYYYFIDGRLKGLGNVFYNNQSALSNFTDYTGFYNYDHSNNSYYKTDILPSLYFDSSKNDICWKFNGNETGISAIGIAGIDGKSSELSVVHVIVSDLTGTGKVDGVFNKNKLNEEPQWDQSQEAINNLKEGPALISITIKNPENQENENQENPHVIAFGIVETSDNEKYAYWNSDTILDSVASCDMITSYFYNMGSNNNNYPKFLAIPSMYDRTTSWKNAAHIITTEKNTGSTTGDLVFVHSDNAFISETEHNSEYTASNKKNACFTNYNIVVGNKSESTHTTITNQSISVVGTTAQFAMSVDGSSKIKGKLNVSGEVGVTGSLNITGKIGVTGTNNFINARVKNNTAISILGKTKIEGEVGVTGDVNIWGGLKTLSGSNYSIQLYSGDDNPGNGIRFFTPNTNYTHTYIENKGKQLNFRRPKANADTTEMNILIGSNDFSDSKYVGLQILGSKDGTTDNDIVKIKPNLIVEGKLEVTNSAIITQKFGYWDTDYYNSDDIPETEDYSLEDKYFKWDGSKFVYDLSTGKNKMYFFKKPYGVISLNHNANIGPTGDPGVIYFGFKSDIYPERSTVFIRSNDKKGGSTNKHYLHLMGGTGNFSLENNNVYMCILFGEFSITENSKTEKYRKMDVFKIG